MFPYYTDALLVLSVATDLGITNKTKSTKARNKSMLLIPVKLYISSQKAAKVAITTISNIQLLVGNGYQ